ARSPGGAPSGGAGVAGCAGPLRLAGCGGPSGGCLSGSGGDVRDSASLPTSTEARGDMARYVAFFSYTGEAAARMVAHPEDRAEAARAVIEAAGGRLEAFYWMFGDYDGLAI